MSKTETGWTKEFPHVEGFYWARRTQTNAPGLTVIQVWQYEDEWFAYRFANQNDIETKDFVRSLYEYLGPISPASAIDATIRMRSACIEKVKEMKRDWLIHFKQTNKPEYFALAEGADEIISKLESVTIQEQEKQ